MRSTSTGSGTSRSEAAGAGGAPARGGSRGRHRHPRRRRGERVHLRQGPLVVGGPLAGARIRVHRLGGQEDPLPHLHPVLRERRHVRGAAAAGRRLAHGGAGDDRVLRGAGKREHPQRHLGVEPAASPRCAFATTETASAIATVLHETLHRQGVRDERITECFANDAIKYVGWLAHWNSLATRDDATWAASEAIGSRARDLAFAASRHSVAQEYQMPRAECLRLTRSFSSGEYRRPR